MVTTNYPLPVAGQGDAESRRRIRTMRWFIRRKRQEDRTSEAEAAHAAAEARLTAAERQRDTERRKMRDERSSVVQPLRDIHDSNHLSELAMRALRRNGRLS